MKGGIVAVVCAFTAQVLMGQTAPHVPLGIASDWAHHHVLFPDSKDGSMMAQIQRDPRWMQNWYLRHREVWWPQHHPGHREGSHRDWSVPLSASPLTSGFEPLFDFSYMISLDTGYGSLNATDIGGGRYLATAGTLTVTGSLTGNPGGGSYPLYPDGPSATLSPSGDFIVDNVLYPSIDPSIDVDGLLFTGSGFEINIWGNAPDDYEFDDENGSGYTNDATGAAFTLSIAPGGGQTFPAKFVFDVTAAPSCTNDFVVVGIPAYPASGGQANIVGVNNLYSGGSGALCSTGPAVMFAYASGTGHL